MARFLALEWNETEARLAVATSRVGHVVIEQAFSVALESGQPGAAPTAVDVGERIGTALAARGLGRIDTLVAVGRSNVELRQLSVPPAPDEELPELVHFQALREFNALDEDWPLDFISLDDASDQPRNVLAAAIDPARVGQIEATCRAAGLRPRRLILRPCAAASLLRRSQASGRMQLRLLIDLLVDEADMTVLIDRKVIFLRCARLPGDPLSSAEASGALLSEIRRTMAAVQNQLGGREVETLVLCGVDTRHEALARLIQEQLATSTELFDPFGGLDLEQELRRALPDLPGRFAPLLGTLLDELEGAPHAIDFLHPRQPPEPPSRRNTYLLAGLAACLVVLGGILLGWYAKRSLRTSIGRLSQESASLDKEITRADEFAKVVKEIDGWAYPDVAWLDELYRLSANFPASDEAILTQLRMSPHRQGAEIELNGRAKDLEALEALEQYITADRVFPENDGAATDPSAAPEGGSTAPEDVPPDPSRRVVSKFKTEDKSQAHYNWRFSSSLLIKRENP
jgi:Tfp pilus assembly PilM family ATPase/Tfp pilus assembly protein PilN